MYVYPNISGSVEISFTYVYYHFLQLNDGTNYAQSVRLLNLTSSDEDAAFDNYTLNLFVDNRTITPYVLTGIRKNYPANDSTAGAPFNTGDSLYDRAASWYTDEMYLAPRRLFFDKAASLQPLFGYYFTEFIPGNDPSRGGELRVVLPRYWFSVFFYQWPMGPNYPCSLDQRQLHWRAILRISF